LGPEGFIPQPRELLRLIYQHCNSDDFKSLDLTCKLFNEMGRDRPIRLIKQPHDTLIHTNIEVPPMTIYDVSMKHLSSCKYISLVRSYMITDVGLQNLGSCNGNTRTIDISYSQNITSEGIKYIGCNCGKCTIVAIDCNNMDDEWLRYMANYGSIDITMTIFGSITDEGIRHLVNTEYRNKDKISIKQVDGITSQSLVDLFAHNTYNDISLSISSAIDENVLINIASDSNSIHLSGIDNNICDRHMKYICNFNKVSLSRCNNITDDGIKYLANNYKGDTISITHCRGITEDGFMYLLSKCKFNSMTFSSCNGITDHVLMQLNNRCGYKIIIDECRYVTYKCLYFLTGYEIIDITGCTNMFNNEYPLLPRCRKITALQSDIGGAIIKSLPNCTEMDLMLCSNIIEYDYYDIPSSIDRIYMSGSNITDNVLHKLPPCSTICIDDGAITDKGLLKMAPPAHNYCHIVLSGCDNITNDGLRALSNYRSVYLGGCYNITDNGLCHLSYCGQVILDRCPNITTKGLSYLSCAYDIQVMGYPLLRIGNTFIHSDKFITNRKIHDTTIKLINVLLTTTNNSSKLIKIIAALTITPIMFNKGYPFVGLLVLIYGYTIFPLDTLYTFYAKYKIHRNDVRSVSASIFTLIFIYIALSFWCIYMLV
jgi:hypothetical protein